MSKVVLVRCESYEYSAAKAAVQKGIDLLGGAPAFAKPGEKILLKPNWLVAIAPERNATTHPSVFKAVCEVFLAAGVQLTYGDSPSYHSPQYAAQKTGFLQAAAELGIPLADFHTGKQILHDSAIQNKVFTIANGVLHSDGMISLPKLKTHGFLKLTGAVKNQFGCIPGKLKAEFHLKLQKPLDFARMLIDLNMYLKPRLYIMDGVIAMEGNGPLNGTAKKMNVLLFSADPIALDATVCRIINVNPEYSYTITQGKEAGLGVFSQEEIELLGDPIESFIDSEFKVNRTTTYHTKLAGGLLQCINKIFVPRPTIDENKCKKCGVCVSICPAKLKAVDWHDGDKGHAPSIRYDRCIRCYCCQEVCPEGAIQLKKPVLRKLIGRKKREEK